MQENYADDHGRILLVLVIITLLVAAGVWIAENWAAVLLILIWIFRLVLFLSGLGVIVLLVRREKRIRQACAYARSLDGRLEWAEEALGAALTLHRRQAAELRKTAADIRLHRDRIGGISQGSFLRGETAIQKHLALVAMLQVRIALLEAGQQRVDTFRQELDFHRYLNRANRRTGLIGRDLDETAGLQDEIDYFLAPDIDGELARLAAAGEEAIHLVDLKTAAFQLRFASRHSPPHLPAGDRKAATSSDAALDLLLEEVDLHLEKLEAIQELTRGLDDFGSVG